VRGCGRSEGALIVAAGKAGLTSSGTGNAQAGYDSFESDFQYMATLQSKPDQLIYVKGSTEAILKRCAQRLNTEDTWYLWNHSGGAEAECNGRAGLRVPFLPKASQPLTIWIILISDQGLVSSGCKDDRSAASGNVALCVPVSQPVFR